MAHETASCWTPELLEAIRSEARNAGFDLAGVAAAPAAEDPEGAESARRFATWIDEGRAGEMEYLARRSTSGALLRESARTAMPWARSVLVCALNYNLAGREGPAPRSIDPVPSATGWIARYAWTGGPSGEPLDYHDDLLRRLRRIESALHASVACETRCYVDTGPLLERDFAARAGIGWIGKNTCVLNQQLGSWLLLGVIVTSLSYQPEPGVLTLAPDRCGSCTRCIDACPTDALLTPADGTRAMDATRCIAYLTIEKKGDIPEELRAPMGRQVFGCDICQEVCPWNRRAPKSSPEGLSLRDQLINPALDWLAGLDGPGFNQLFRGSPLERTRRKRLLRNVAVAMGNSGETSFQPRLEAWLQQDDDPILQEHAAWALNQLRASASIESKPMPERDHA